MGYETIPHSTPYRTINFQHLLIKAGFRQAYLPYFLLSQNVKGQCKPNAERRELALKSYAEVKPDFAEGKDTTQTPRNPNFSST